MEVQEILITPIMLRWSDWIEWERFLLDARTHPSAIQVPNSSGVYEAKYKNEQTRLTIGKASNLRMRIKQGLVKGKVPHSTGDRIRELEDTSKIVIRWAKTDRPSAVEEELHKMYVQIYGNLPTHTIRT